MHKSTSLTSAAGERSVMKCTHVYMYTRIQHCYKKKIMKYRAGNLCCTAGNAHADRRSIQKINIPNVFYAAENYLACCRCYADDNVASKRNLFCTYVFVFVCACTNEHYWKLS